MKKRVYRAVAIKDLDRERLARQLPEQVFVGIDVAKKVMFAVLMDSEEKILAVFKWDHLSESRQVARWLASLAPVKSVAMEPSGTYGDALRACLEQAGLRVFRVGPKKVKDASEIFDGVPSTHDAKASAIIAWLHLLGRSDVWEEASAQERELKAQMGLLRLHDRAFRQAQNTLEAQLARYWPEATKLLALDSVALLELIGRYGGPKGVVEAPEQAAACLRQAGRGGLREAKIEKILKAARTTVGVPMLAPECRALGEFASEARHRQKAVQVVKKRIEKLSLQRPETLHLSKQVGLVTSAVLFTELGPLKSYHHCGGLLKAAGLNLKERSSGRRQGQLAITKRGSSRLRQYLYLAVLRWVQKDPVARAWYEKKVQRGGNRNKRRALVALMRKLLQGLWWVARGAAFDSTQLFDTKRLGIPA